MPLPLTSLSILTITKGQRKAFMVILYLYITFPIKKCTIYFSIQDNLLKISHKTLVNFSDDVILQHQNLEELNYIEYIEINNSIEKIIPKSLL